MRPKSAIPAVDAAISRIAERQHGVVSLAQLVNEVGISRRGVSHRAAAGRLHRIHRGVYAVGHRRLSNEGRWMAAVLACGEGAALSHLAAAAVWGMRSAPSGPIDVTVPTTNGRESRPGIRLHRSTCLPPSAVMIRKGIATTTPARTLDDIRSLLAPDQLRSVLRQAEIRRLDVGKQAGYESDSTRSELERVFLRLCRRHRLPRPEVNVRIDAFEADFLWRDRRLIVEVDGYETHGIRSAFEADRARDARLKLLGFDVVRFTWRQVTDDRAAVAATVRALLRGK